MALERTTSFTLSTQQGIAGEVGVSKQELLHHPYSARDCSGSGGLHADQRDPERVHAWVVRMLQETKSQEWSPRSALPLTPPPNVARLALARIPLASLATKNL